MISRKTTIFGASYTTTAFKYQILLIDFGKATTIDGGKHYSLNDHEKREYRINYPHLAH